MYSMINTDVLYLILFHLILVYFSLGLTSVDMCIKSMRILILRSLQKNLTCDITGIINIKKMLKPFIILNTKVN